MQAERSGTSFTFFLKVFKEEKDDKYATKISIKLLN